MIVLGRQNAGGGIFSENSSPKRNRLDQCLLGSKESQKALLFMVFLWIKALIVKALLDFYTASQALMPQLTARNGENELVRFGGPQNIGWVNPHSWGIHHD